MNEIEDRVRFIMPESREYQIAAMTVIQKFVNEFGIKAINEDQSGATATYTLRYELVDFNPSAMQFFRKIGLSLKQEPEENLPEPTMVVDLSVRRLNKFRTSGRHIVQVCGAMCGVECHPLPKIRRMRIMREGEEWLYEPSLGDLTGLADESVTGVVGYCSAATYLAASMGLAVIELAVSTEPEAWLTKWSNALYRRVIVDPDDSTVTGAMIAQAKESIRRTLGEMIAKCQQVPAAAAEDTPIQA